MKSPWLPTRSPYQCGAMQQLSLESHVGSSGSMQPGHEGLLGEAESLTVPCTGHPAHALLLRLLTWV